MNRQDIEALIKKCGGTIGNYQRRGYGWAFLFINRRDGAQIGKITLLDDEVVNFKNYKKDYHDSVDEEDWIMFRMNRIMHDGVEFSDEELSVLYAKAVSIRDEDLAKKKQWRADNPATINPRTGKRRKRRGLQARNVRNIFRNLVMGE